MNQFRASWFFYRGITRLVQGRYDMNWGIRKQGLALNIVWNLLLLEATKQRFQKIRASKDLIKSHQGCNLNVVECAFIPTHTLAEAPLIRTVQGHRFCQSFHFEQNEYAFLYFLFHFIQLLSPVTLPDGVRRWLPHSRHPVWPLLKHLLLGHDFHLLSDYELSVRDRARRFPERRLVCK